MRKTISQLMHNEVLEEFNVQVIAFSIKGHDRPVGIVFWIPILAIPTTKKVVAP
jgi:hypothetical protein